MNLQTSSSCRHEEYSNCILCFVIENKRVEMTNGYAKYVTFYDHQLSEVGTFVLRSEVASEEGYVNDIWYLYDVKSSGFVKSDSKPVAGLNCKKTPKVNKNVLYGHISNTLFNGFVDRISVPFNDEILEIEDDTDYRNRLMCVIFATVMITFLIITLIVVLTRVI